MLLEKERELVAAYGRKVYDANLTTGTTGNISLINREKNLIAISPSGMAYDEISPSDVVVVDLAMNVVDGTRLPSSEWALHTVFYQNRPDINAVIHTHSLYCTIFAALRQPLRAVHYEIAENGADTVPCAQYATYGTEELAQNAIAACGKQNNAVLLANHGLVASGRDLKSAFSLVRGLEYVAQLQYMAQCIGNPTILSPDEINKVAQKFASYGQPKGEKNV